MNDMDAETNPNDEWLHVDGGATFPAGALRMPVRRVVNADSLRELLPLHVHIADLTGRDVTSGEELSYVLVWADRSYNTCPRCGQTVVADLADEPPAMLDTGAGQGGAVIQFSQQDGCGEWLTVDWSAFTGGETTDEILAAAQRMADDRNEAIAAAVAKLEVGLRDDVEAAAARVAEPLEAGETFEDRLDEVRTGSEVEPGVYVEGDQLVAWAPHPVDPNADTIAAETTLPRQELNR